MDISRFFSQVPVKAVSAPLEPGARALTLGSCFATEVETFLGGAGFAVIPSPGGLLYNPLSIAHTLGRALEGRPYIKEDVVLNRGSWVSFHHGGAFRGRTQSEALEGINAALAQAHAALTSLDVLILTLGTAYVYEHRARGHVVASCHRAPGKDFKRRPASVEEGATALLEPLRVLRGLNPTLKVVVTVSPVRHLRDDPTENSHSKAICRLIAHELVEGLDATYFPSFEIVLDELRDYRFFGPDRAHPTPEAVAYVMDRFADAYLSRRSRALLKEVGVIQRGMAHQPSNPGGVEDRAFCEGLLRRALALQGAYPEAQLGALMTALKGRAGGGEPRP